MQSAEEKNTGNGKLFLSDLFLESIIDSQERLKGKLAQDILNCQISFLYRNKIYDERARRVETLLDGFSEEVDDLINQHYNGIRSVTNALIDISENMVLPDEIKKERGKEDKYQEEGAEGGDKGEEDEKKKNYRYE